MNEGSWKLEVYEGDDTTDVWVSRDRQWLIKTRSRWKDLVEERRLLSTAIR